MANYISAMTKTGDVVCYIIDSTDIVSCAEQIHKTSSVVTAAFGRLLTAASLMGSRLKGDGESVDLQL